MGGYMNEDTNGRILGHLSSIAAQGTLVNVITKLSHQGLIYNIEPPEWFY